MASTPRDENRVPSIQGKNSITGQAESINSTSNAAWVYIKGSSIGTGDGTDFEGSPITVGTTAVEVAFTGQTSAIFIQSHFLNTGYIYIGKSNVTSSGSNAMCILEPGASLSLDFNDASNSIYVVSTVAGQTVYKLALI